MIGSANCELLSMRLLRLLPVVAACGDNALPTGPYECSRGSWESAGTIVGSHFEAFGIGLADGRALVAGGHTAISVADPAGYFVTESEVWDPATNAWSLADPLPRYLNVPTGALLADGTVLFPGGPDDVADEDHALVFDPAAGSWSPVARLGGRHVNHSTTALADGRVLVVGGMSFSEEAIGSPAHADAELFDPGTRTWSPATPMIEGRFGHGAVRLASGDVLVAGGMTASDGRVLKSAERYDPETDRWLPAAAMTEPRSVALTLLVDGRVLAVGGSIFVPDHRLASAEIYDPALDTWTPVGAMSTVRQFGTFTLLPDGSVLAVGGNTKSGGNAVKTAERFDPATTTWTLVDSPITGRVMHNAFALPDGALVAAGMITSLGTFDQLVVKDAERFMCPRLP